MNFIIGHKKLFITLLIFLGALIVFIIKVATYDDYRRFSRSKLLRYTNNLDELKTLIDEVSNKEFVVDGVIKDEYANTLNRINILSEQLVDKTTFFGNIRNYNYTEHKVIQYSAKMDLISLLSVTDRSLLDSKSKRKMFLYAFMDYSRLYSTPLMSLYENNIDVNAYLQEYKEPFCSHEECMEELKRQVTFLGDEKKVIDSLNLSLSDNNIKDKIVKNYQQSYSLYGINSGLYEYVEQFNQWEAFHEVYITSYNESVFLKNLYKYKASKAMKNIYLSKIYMQFMMLDDKYVTKFDKQQMEQEYPEEFYEESTLFVSGCTNPKYLLENTLNKCVSFIKNAPTKEDAFSYLEDENMKDYVMIDDKLCATREGSKYKFYENDNIMCKTLKEKFNDNTNTNTEINEATNIDTLIHYIDEIRPYMDNVTKQAEELRAKGENLDSILFVDGMEVNKLLDDALKGIYEVERIKKYNGELYKQIKNIAKKDLASYIYFTANNESKVIANTYLGAVKIYTNEIYNLYKSNIDVIEFLNNYSSSDKMYEEMVHYKPVEAFQNAKNILKQYNLNNEDEEVVKNIFQFATSSLVYYGLLYKQLEKEYSEVWDNIVLLQPVNDDGSNMVNNFLKYKMAKIIKSLYVSKIAAELFILESTYANRAEQIIINDEAKQAYFKELASNQNKMIVEACKHTRFLSSNRQAECVDIINSKTNDEAFAFLEDSNAKGYVMFDDIICAKSENSQYKFYDNDNIMCETLKEKLAD